MNNASTSKKTNPFVSVAKELKKNYPYYLMMLPAVTFVFFLSYLPMPGIIIAFKNYNFQKGIFGSAWTGLSNFKFFFTSDYAARTTWNTIWINLNYLFWTTLVSVSFAIMLNELRAKKAVRVYQNLMFLPYFFSAIIVGKIVTSVIFATDAGLANQILTFFGLDKVNWVKEPAPWVKIIVGTHVWQVAGYNIIIYLATITGIDEEMYEAAAIDGAGRIKKIMYITLPMLLPAIILLTLLSIGKMMFGDFATIYAIIEDKAQLFPRTDIIETYIFRAVRKTADFGTSSAMGLYQSVVGFILVFGSNFIAKKFDKDYGIF